MSSYYDVLGIARTASTDEIRKAFQKLAKKTHPDLNPGKDPLLFRAITEAFNVLRDPRKRSKYDATLNSFPPDCGVDPASYTSSRTEHDMDEWLKRMSRNFDGFARENSKSENEKKAAYRMAAAAAWDLEKKEAFLRKLRNERMKRRSEHARAVRHATVLRRFWQTNHAITVPDVIIAGLTLTVAVTLLWRATRTPVRTEH